MIADAGYHPRENLTKLLVGAHTDTIICRKYGKRCERGMNTVGRGGPFLSVLSLIWVWISLGFHTPRIPN